MEQLSLQQINIGLAKDKFMYGELSEGAAVRAIIKEDPTIDVNDLIDELRALKAEWIESTRDIFNVAEA